MFNGHDKFTKIFYELNRRDFERSDCYGICYLFNKHVLGRDIPCHLEDNVKTKEDINAAYKDKQSKFIKVSKGRECAGDIISLDIKNFPMHVGVVVKKGTMLHIMEDRHATIESYNSIKWKNKINSFWRYESIK